MDETILSGVDLTPHVQAMVLLASLPPSWQPFVTTKTTPNLSVPMLVPTILQESTMRQSLSSTTHATPLAMVANSSRYRRPHQSRRSLHSSQRYNRSRFSPKGGFQLKKPYCKICARPGHHTRDCWHNKGKSQSNPHRNQANYASDSDCSHSSSNSSYSQSSKSSDADVNLAFMAFTPETLSSHTTWVLDTGATCHLTAYREWLSE